MNESLEIFDKRRIKSGDKLIINSKTYEVLTVAPDAHPAPERKSKVRMYLRIDLHDLKSKSLTSTHELYYYWEDTKELALFDIKNKKEEKIEPQKVRLAK